MNCASISWSRNFGRSFSNMRHQINRSRHFSAPLAAHHLASRAIIEPSSGIDVSLPRRSEHPHVRMRYWALISLLPCFIVFCSSLRSFSFHACNLHACALINSLHNYICGAQSHFSSASIPNCRRDAIIKTTLLFMFCVFCNRLSRPWQRNKCFSVVPSLSRQFKFDSSFLINSLGVKAIIMRSFVLGDKFSFFANKKTWGWLNSHAIKCCKLRWPECCTCCRMFYTSIESRCRCSWEKDLNSADSHVRIWQFNFHSHTGHRRLLNLVVSESIHSSCILKLTKVNRTQMKTKWPDCRLDESIERCGGFGFYDAERSRRAFKRCHRMLLRLNAIILHLLPCQFVPFFSQSGYRKQS